MTTRQHLCCTSLLSSHGECVSPGVKVTVESLPRSESSLLAVKLDTLFLRDLTTQGTIFPFLVSPKTVKILWRHGQLPSESEIRDDAFFFTFGVFYVGDHRTRWLWPAASPQDSPAALVGSWFRCKRTFRQWNVSELWEEDESLETPDQD